MSVGRCSSRSDQILIFDLFIMFFSVLFCSIALFFYLKIALLYKYRTVISLSGFK